MKKIVPVILGLMFTQSVYAENLLQVYEQARKNNPDLKIAEANKNSAYVAISGKRASLLPQLGLSASYGLSSGYNDAKGKNSGSANASINLSQSLFDYSRWKSLGIAKQQASIADIAYQAQEQALILNVAVNYFNVLRAVDSVSFAKAQKESVQKKLEQTKQQHAVGLASITDVQTAQSNFDLNLAQELTAQNNINDTLENLRQISGQFYSKLLTVNDKKFEFLKPSNLDELLKQSENKNLELLTAKLSRDIAKEQINVANSGHMPSLNLTASTGISDSKTYDNNFNQTAKSFTGSHSVGISLNLPIYSGGSTSSAVKQAQYSYVTSSEKLESINRTVVNKLRSSYNNIAASASLVKAYEQSVVSAQSLLNATESGYKVGTRTMVDVLNATSQLFNAKKQLSDAKYNYLISQLNLKFAVGTLNADDLIALNNILGKETTTQISNF